MSNIEYLRKNANVFRKLSGKKLAAKLREIVEKTNGDEDAEYVFEQFCILRAADLIENASEGRGGAK